MNEITLTLKGRQLWYYLPDWDHDTTKMDHAHPILFLDEKPPGFDQRWTVREGRVLEYYNGTRTDIDGTDTPVLCIKVLTMEGKIRPLAATHVKAYTRSEIFTQEN